MSKYFAKITSHELQSWSSNPGREGNFFLHTGTGYNSLGVIGTLDYFTWYESDRT